MSDYDPRYLAASADLFWNRVARADDCWPWTMARHEGGYGRARLPGCPTMPAHVVAYVLTYGPVPDGHEVDHNCNNPPCCNPDHLEAVTPAENKRRARERRGFVASIHERHRVGGGISWQVKWRTYDEDGSWRQQSRTFRSRADAEVFVAMQAAA